MSAVAASCDRLVHASVIDARRRQRQGRLIGLMLAAPFFAAGAIALLVGQHLGASMTMTLVCTIFMSAGALTLLVAATGRQAVAEALALSAATALVTALIASAGGAASPVVLIACALPFETFWVTRSAGHTRLAGAVGLATLPMQTLLATHFAPAGPVDVWHWLVPLGYLAFVLPRIAPLLAAAPAQSAGGSDIEDGIDGVVLRIDEGGEVETASARTRELLNVAPELLLGTGLFERVHVADRVAYMRALNDLRGTPGFLRLDIRVRMPILDGQTTIGIYKPFLLELARPARDGAPIIAVIRQNDDVLALRAALAERSATADGSEIAKARFLAAVSHELRTPLNAIIGFSDVLLHGMFGGFSDPRQKEYVGLVKESGNHLLAVVNAILDVSKIESGTYATCPEPFLFKDAVSMAHAMLSGQASAKKLTFNARVTAEVGEVVADRRAVQQMLINLISNAIKFTPDGGSVTIGGKRIGSRLHFWVSDTGIGITSDDLTRIGTPFMQVQNDYTRQHEGTGLGLSLVKGLVSLHDGTMDIESEPGQGTTVTISLPANGPAERRTSAATVTKLTPLAPSEEIDGPLRKTA